MEDKSGAFGDGGVLLYFQSDGVESYHLGDPCKGVEAVTSSHSMPSNAIFQSQNFPFSELPFMEQHVII
jgi:hypothetical protein